MRRTLEYPELVRPVAITDLAVEGILLDRSFGLVLGHPAAGRSAYDDLRPFRTVAVLDLEVVSD